MQFTEFRERPVNYHKEILHDVPFMGEAPPENQDVTKRIESAVNERLNPMRQQFEQELQKKYQEGVASGQLSASAEMNRAVEMLAQTAKLLEAEKRELASRLESQATQLGFELAERILGREIAERPEAVADVAREAIKHVLDCGKITVRAHPDDVQFLLGLQKEIETAISSETKFEVRADAEIARGGCMVDTEKGTVDARIASQLDTLKTHAATSGA
jgi:flagellar assembly protein FliH